MYDSWVQATEDKMYTGVCMLDMSAAFDVVDHSILLKKLELYGFDPSSLAWIENYLSGRSHAVYIELMVLSPLTKTQRQGFHRGLS